MKNEIGLQPLKIPGGWEIGINHFYEVDQDIDDDGKIDNVNSVWANYLDFSYLLDLRAPCANILLDWTPQFEPQGFYHLEVEQSLKDNNVKLKNVEKTEKGSLTYTLNHDGRVKSGSKKIVFECYSTSRVVIVNLLEKIMSEIDLLDGRSYNNFNDLYKLENVFKDKP